MSEPIDEDNPTDEERAAIERAWYAGEPLPEPWVVLELPAGTAAPGVTIEPRSFLMLRKSKLAAFYAGQVGDDS